MLKGSIEFKKCHTMGDVEIAVEEALRLIKSGITRTWGNENETGYFQFNIEGAEEEGVN